MNSEFQKGFITGLAVKPLSVTTGADIVKFGTHNLMADCTFNSPFGARINGEIVTVSVPANLSVAWYKLITNTVSFKHNYMYKLVAKFNGYGRIGLSTTSNAPFVEVGMHTSGTRDDNYLVGVIADTANFYVNVRRNVIGDGIQTAQLWFCSDETYNENRAAHSLNIALYEEVKNDTT